MAGGAGGGRGGRDFSFSTCNHVRWAARRLLLVKNKIVVRYAFYCEYLDNEMVAVYGRIASLV